MHSERLLKARIAGVERCIRQVLMHQPIYSKRAHLKAGRENKETTYKIIVCYALNSSQKKNTKRNTRYTQALYYATSNA